MITWRTVLARSAVLAAALGLMAAGVYAEDAAIMLDEVHKQAGVPCAACHAEQPPAAAPPHGTCVGCHGSAAEIAARTADLLPNPHVSPHLPEGEAQPCADCHHVHAAQEVTCIACHKALQRRLQQRKRGGAQP